MLKSEDLVIGDSKFTTTQYPAMRGLELMALLAKTVGPALAALQGASMDMELSSFAPVLSGALATLKPAEASSLVIEVLTGTSAHVAGPNGQIRIVQLNSREHIDLVFSSKLKTMFQVLAHAIKVNYADFIEGSDPTAPLTQAPSAS